MVVVEQYAYNLEVSREFAEASSAVGGDSARKEAQNGDSDSLPPCPYSVDAETYFISLAYDIIREHPDKVSRIAFDSTTFDHRKGH